MPGLGAANARASVAAVKAARDLQARMPAFDGRFDDFNGNGDGSGVYAIGDQVLLAAQVIRLDNGGRAVMLAIPTVLGAGLNYVVTSPDAIQPRGTR